MITSLNWLKEYIDIDLSPKATGDLLTSLGLEVEGMEEVESIKGGLEGVVVGQVVECDKHPNADRLSLTKVDVGSNEPLQVVCGAPNVTAGQKVLVATTGTTLHPTEGEPFKIKKGKIRGEVSEGMICAEDELGIGTDHNGIIVLPADTPVGMAGRDFYKIEKDVVYDIGLTPNRSDATCHLGVAKDLAAALKIQHGSDGKIRMPRSDTPTIFGKRRLAHRSSGRKYGSLSPLCWYFHKKCDHRRIARLVEKTTDGHWGAAHQQYCGHHQFHFARIGTAAPRI